MAGDDYMLQGTAMVALARIGDPDAVPIIESILMRSANPRVKISAVCALEAMATQSMHAVLGALKAHL